MNFAQQGMERKKKEDPLANHLREDMARASKDFKTAWVTLAQGLFTIYRDKLFHAWGFDKFEDYLVRELGLTKAMGNKLIKNYAFIENEEPVYLKKEFSESRESLVVPGIESVDILRLAHRNKELTRDDYMKLRKDVFDKGKDPTLIKQDLTALMKERKQVDPEEEREMRHTTSVRRFLTAIKSFKKDMESLKLLEADILEAADKLLVELEEKYS